MAGPTVSLGLTLIVPAVKGGRNWYDEFITFTNALSSHDHTGGGNGTQISGSAIKLINNDYLQGTEFGGGAADIITVNTSDEVEFGVYDFRLNGDILVDKASDLIINHEGAQAITFATNNINRWTVQSGGDLVPAANLTNDLGGPSNNLLDVHANRYRGSPSSSMTIGPDTAQDIVLQTNGTFRWRVVSSGDLVPAANLTYDIGTSILNVTDVHANRYRGSPSSSMTIGPDTAQDVILQTNGTFR